jgi:hypothetical protein
MPPQPWLPQSLGQGFQSFASFSSAENGNPEQQVLLKRKTFETGQVVPQSGIYSVTHAEHRLPHEVTLLRADTFPPCAKCGVQVRFALLRGVTPDSFKVVLNRLPEVAAMGDAEDLENAG